MTLPAGAKWKPETSYEAWNFETRWCATCIHDVAYREAMARQDYAPGCSILRDAHCFQTADQRFPRAWRVDGVGAPRCSEWRPL